MTVSGVNDFLNLQGFDFELFQSSVREHTRELSLIGAKLVQDAYEEDEPL
jgi:hypothetical protein